MSEGYTRNTGKLHDTFAIVFSVTVSYFSYDFAGCKEFKQCIDVEPTPTAVLLPLKTQGLTTQFGLASEPIRKRGEIENEIERNPRYSVKVK